MSVSRICISAITTNYHLHSENNSKGLTAQLLGHKQWYELSKFRHVPPFWQGLLLQDTLWTVWGGKRGRKHEPHSSVLNLSHFNKHLSDRFKWSYFTLKFCHLENKETWESSCVMLYCQIFIVNNAVLFWLNTQWAVLFTHYCCVLMAYPRIKVV